jgi:hypothetical protein
MKRDFLDLLDEVEDTCQRSSARDSNATHAAAAATPRAHRVPVGRRRDPPHTSILSYLVTSLMFGHRRAADDDV